MAVYSANRRSDFTKSEVALTIGLVPRLPWLNSLYIRGVNRIAFRFVPVRSESLGRFTQLSRMGMTRLDERSAHKASFKILVIPARISPRPVVPAC